MSSGGKSTATTEPSPEQTRIGSTSSHPTTASAITSSTAGATSRAPTPPPPDIRELDARTGQRYVRDHYWPKGRPTRYQAPAPGASTYFQQQGSPVYGSNPSGFVHPDIRAKRDPEAKSGATSTRASSQTTPSAAQASTNWWRKD